jgi:hypothetical protein
MAINKLGGGFDYAAMDAAGVHIIRRDWVNIMPTGDIFGTDTISYNPGDGGIIKPSIDWSTGIVWNAPGEAPLWFTAKNSGVALLAHELQHAQDQLNGATPAQVNERDGYSQHNAIRTQNKIMAACIAKQPGSYNIGKTKDDGTPWSWRDYMRPGGFPWTETLPAPPWRPRR